jgi:hypothetical protein
LKRLVAIPFVCAAISAVGMLMSDSAAPQFYRVVLILAASATAWSAFATMRLFATSDKLFRSWALLGTGYALAALRYAYRLMTLMTGLDFLAKPVLDAMLILQNVLIAIALWLFVSAWRTTGLATPGSRASRTGWTLAGFAVALLVGGYPLLHGIATASADTVLLVSTLGDIVGIALIVPLMMSALALRGGLLMHTWLYLAACELAWMMYDLWLAFRQTGSLSPRIGQGIEQMIRIVAIMLAFIATVAQRRAVR